MKASPATDRFFLAAVPLLVLILGAIYLGYSLMLAGTLGFPLDDSWIHETIARNLANYGRPFYNPGEVASGSTAPLWTLLLSAGYVLNLDFKIWAYVLGLLFHGLGGAMVFLLSRKLFPTRPGLAKIATIAFLLEWRLAWAALSGMETSLFIFLSLCLLYLTASFRVTKQHSFGRLAAQGAAGGLIFLTRPEGIVLFLLAMMWNLIGFVGIALSNGRNAEERELSASAKLPGAYLGIAKILVIPLVVSLVFVVPYLLFNLAATGQPLPGTYYAKNSAYGEALDLGSTLRYLGGVANFLGFGPTLMLVPGFVVSVVVLVRRLLRKNGNSDHFGDSVDGYIVLLPLVWIGALVLMYLIKLPVLYQHGRYIMPILPVAIIYGVWGLMKAGGKLQFGLLKRTYALLAATLYAVLFINGSTTYAWNVKFIEDEQVAVAKWLKANTPADAIIATHDIGALGYYSERRLFDTAGIINPEMAPYARDQARILEMAEQRQVSFFAIIPSWYPKIAADGGLTEVYHVRFDNPLVKDAENMVVFQLR